MKKLYTSLFPFQQLYELGIARLLFWPLFDSQLSGLQKDDASRRRRLSAGMMYNEELSRLAYEIERYCVRLCTGQMAMSQVSVVAS